MGARGWIAVVVGVGLAAPLAAPVSAAPKEPADPKPKLIDKKELEAPLVLQDSSGGTYVVDKPTENGARAWYGTGTALYEQQSGGRSRDGAAWQLSIWAPRVPHFRPGVIQMRKDGTFRKSCDQLDDAELSLLVGDKAKAVLDKVKLYTPALVRRPYMLARDDTGVYYFVDRLLHLHGGKGFRVMVGRKGGLKSIALKDVASDSGGDVFSTKSGDLRLVRVDDHNRTMTWIKGNKRTELVQLPIEDNTVLIFSDLGVYKFLGTICDNV